ncbi:hypothetical protein MTR67_000568 [Solanum verrucosum]|uniref:ATP-dependent DNA helicase n=1 Tax=Solanum verrucosum TaxID=315347 RepID=A0AAF0PLL9_SOLVR|nr:hypothetical protein MTR67_000568 [Solanum verrucosum]
MGYIALATTTSGVAASILPGGRTAHSRFKIPIDLDDNTSCNISKESSLAGLIRDANLIVWDEVSMAKKRMLEVLDLFLRDLMDTNTLFGGKVVVLGGDSRQTLPVVLYGKKEDFIAESLLYSTIWNELEKIQLSENMWEKTDPAFCDYLLRVGNGQEKISSVNKIEIPNSLLIPYTTEKEALDKLFTATYGNLHSPYSNSYPTDSRVILTTKNDFVDEINDMLIHRFDGKSKTFIGTDEALEFNNQTQFEDLLHSLNSAVGANGSSEAFPRVVHVLTMLVISPFFPHTGRSRTSIPLLQQDELMVTDHDEETANHFRGAQVNCVLCPQNPDDGRSIIQNIEIGTIFTHHQEIVIVDGEMPNGDEENSLSLNTTHDDDFHQPNFPGASILRVRPREPWHDIHCRTEGPAAWDVLYNFEQRWRKQDDHDTWNVQVFRSIDRGTAFGFPNAPEQPTKSGIISGKENIIDQSIHDAYINAIRPTKHFI